MSIRAASSAGRPIAVNTIINVTRPACGTPAAPILANVAVILMEERKGERERERERERGERAK